ncbi:filamentation induced by cAMP protein Fic [Mycolicibacterium rhodesiae JS60]|nr:filamentation induced by cAMP protein Fic [Mycolicibacterium rhodesiae JS60]
MPHSWDTGDLERNWQGDFIPGTNILRNRVGAQTPEAMRDAENDLVEARVIALRQATELLGDRTYNLPYLCVIRRQLFQDVYVWAGDVRTIGIKKSGESFCPPGSISQPMAHVAAEVHRLNRPQGCSRG